MAPAWREESSGGEEPHDAGALSFHTFRNYVKVTFFRGTSLRPVPPGGKAKDARWIDIHEDDLDEARMTTWIRQAAALPGWGKS